MSSQQKMDSNFSRSELELIFKKRPDLKTLDISIDWIIVDFLKLHNVDIVPATSNIQPSKLTNAVMGLAGGPAATFMNASLTGQQKSVAIQEWTSWKQWALGHPDWLKYKDERTKEIEDRNEKIAQLAVDQDVIKEMNLIISASKEEKQIQKKQAYIALLIVIGSTVAIAILPLLIIALNNTYNPYVIKQIERKKIEEIKREEAEERILRNMQELEAKKEEEERIRRQQQELRDQQIGKPEPFVDDLPLPNN